MSDQPSTPPKPVSEIWRPDLIVLPPLTFARRAFRLFFRLSMKALSSTLMRVTKKGLENFPKKGPAILVYNHSGDVDLVVLAATIPQSVEALAKIENRDDHWLVGPLYRSYGFIWVHRGRPDRRALRVMLEVLEKGRILVLAPEGRQSLTGGLEEGTEGAAFIALKSGAPVYPIAMTGTNNVNVYGNLKKWKRPKVTITIGKPFYVKEQTDHRDSLPAGTRLIMESLARLLPPERRGVYSYISESTPAE